MDSIILRKLLLAGLVVCGGAATCYAQDADTKKDPVIFTTEEDHQHMLKQLGITKLRRGPSGNPDAPDAANQDESKANPCPELPDVLTLENGEKISTPQAWWEKRRPEIVELFEREILGRIPANVPRVKWEVRETRDGKVRETEVIEKHIVGVVDNSMCPEIEVNIEMSLTLPKNADGPVPVLMMFGRTEFQPVPAWFRNRGGGEPDPMRVTRESNLIEAGWGVAKIDPGSIQDDRGGFQVFRFGQNNDDPPPEPVGMGLTRGIIGLCNLGQPRKPDDWGSLRAWGWGASRGLDYLETEPGVDAKRVGIEGVSRYGKAALVTHAFDQRFNMVLIGSSGEGGASLYRRNYGEAVETIAGSGEYHWMCGNFIKYAAEEAEFGSRTACDMPVDSHQLIALCAPRLTFISYGIPEQGDAHWLDQRGSWMAAIAAQPAFRLLGAEDLGRSDDYMKEKDDMPPVMADTVGGELAWRQHDGGHTDAPNIPHFITWAESRWAEQGE